MTSITLDANPSSTEGDTSADGIFVGHLTASVTNTTDGALWDGSVVLETFIDGKWVTSETFDASGVFPGFNAIKGTYRLRLLTKQTQGSAKISVNGSDRPSNFSY